MQKHLLVTTCGTSLITNNLSPVHNTQLATFLRQYANHREQDIPSSALAPLRAHINMRHSQLLQASITHSCNMSAELNGLLNFANRQAVLPSLDAHILVHTDTWLGAQVAEVLADKLKRLGAVPQLHCAADLNTADLSTFQHGMGNLVHWAAQTLPGYQQNQYRIVFNLVGGFKSFQGFMQTLGMFYAHEMIYIFESSDQLLRIPKLPIDLDTAAKQTITDHLPTFRLLDILRVFPSDSPHFKAIPDLFLYRVGDQAELSPWGKIIWNHHKLTLYRSQLLESPTDRIHFADSFRRDSSGLASDRCEILNTRIDDLARYLLDPDKPNPRRLDLKPLKGNPMHPSTHECDAWADADCRRIFLRFDQHRAVLERLAGPLH